MHLTGEGCLAPHRNNEAIGAAGRPTALATFSFTSAPTPAAGLTKAVSEGGAPLLQLALGMPPSEAPLSAELVLQAATLDDMGRELLGQVGCQPKLLFVHCCVLACAQGQPSALPMLIQFPRPAMAPNLTRQRSGVAGARPREGELALGNELTSRTLPCTLHSMAAS